MKAFIAAILFILLNPACDAQKSRVKLYAYKQAVLSGVRPSYETNENDQPVETNRKASFTYFIYLTHASKKIVCPVELWIDGKPFAVQKEIIAATPVEINNSDEPGEKIELVPKTKDRVLQLKPDGDLLSKISLTKSHEADTNELVVVYKWKGKLHVETVKKIERLPSALMQ